MDCHSLLFHSSRFFLHWSLEDNMDPKFSKLTCYLKLQGLIPFCPNPQSLGWEFPGGLLSLVGILDVLISGDHLENELAVTSPEIVTLASPRSGIKALSPAGSCG